MAFEHHRGTWDRSLPAKLKRLINRTIVLRLIWTAQCAAPVLDAALPGGLGDGPRDPADFDRRGGGEGLFQARLSGGTSPAGRGALWARGPAGGAADPLG